MDAWKFTYEMLDRNCICPKLSTMPWISPGEWSLNSMCSSQQYHVNLSSQFTADPVMSVPLASARHTAYPTIRRALTGANRPWKILRQSPVQISRKCDLKSHFDQQDFFSRLDLHKKYGIAGEEREVRRTSCWVRYTKNLSGHGPEDQVQRIRPCVFVGPSQQFSRK